MVRRITASQDTSGSILTRSAVPAYALRPTAAGGWVRPLRHTVCLCDDRNHGYTRTFWPSPAIYGHLNNWSVTCVTRADRKVSSKRELSFRFIHDFSGYLLAFLPYRRF